MKKIVPILTILAFITTLPTTLASFPDVEQGHPYKTAIDFVQSEGIVEGYSDGSYGPEKSINRAEFIKVLIGTILPLGEIDKCPLTSQNLFPDVDPNAWFAKYVCVAKTLKIIGGYPDGTFKPGNTINFAEAAKIIVNTIIKEEISPSDPWFMAYMDKLESRGAVPSSLAAVSDPTERAVRDFSRGEMAESIYRLKVKTVVSNDQLVKLLIPEGALPDGVRLEDVSIKKLTAAEILGTEHQNELTIFGYEFSPDGIQFKKTVAVEIISLLESDEIPAAFLFSEERKTFEALPDFVIDMNSQADKVVMKGNISHFSKVVYYQSFLAALINDIGNYYIGDTVQGTAAVRLVTLNTQSDGAAVDIVEPVNIVSSRWVFMERNPSIVRLKETRIPSPSLSTNSPSFESVTNDFACADEGTGYLPFVVNFDVTYQYSNFLENLFGKPLETLKAYLVVRSNNFLCSKPTFRIIPQAPGDHRVGERFGMNTTLSSDSGSPNNWTVHWNFSETPSQVGPMISITNNREQTLPGSATASPEILCIKKGSTSLKINATLSLPIADAWYFISPIELSTFSPIFQCLDEDEQAPPPPDAPSGSLCTKPYLTSPEQTCTMHCECWGPALSDDIIESDIENGNLRDCVNSGDCTLTSGEGPFVCLQSHNEGAAWPDTTLYYRKECHSGKCVGPEQPHPDQCSGAEGPTSCNPAAPVGTNPCGQ